MKRGVIVGGRGGVGRLLHAHLAATTEIVIVDCDDGGEDEDPRLLHGDIRTPSAAIGDALGDADLVVLAVPEDVALDALPVVLSRMSPGSLLVDTLSVKTNFARAFAESAASVEALSLSPMFAPSLGFSGQNVAAINLAGGPRSSQFVELVERWGARVSYATAAEHDAAAVATQALTHGAIIAFGRSLRGLGVDIETLLAVAPPPHRTLLALLARLVTAPPEVYWDIQVANPNAARGREALVESAAWLAAAARGADPEVFFAELEALRRFLGTSADHLAATCASMFELFRRPNGPSTEPVPQ